MDRINTDNPRILLEGVDNYAVWEEQLYYYANTLSLEFVHYMMTGETDCYGADENQLKIISQQFEFSLGILLGRWVPPSVAATISLQEQMTPIEELAFLEKKYGVLLPQGFIRILHKRYPFTSEGANANYAERSISKSYLLGTDMVKIFEDNQRDICNKYCDKYCPPGPGADSTQSLSIDALKLIVELVSKDINDHNTKFIHEKFDKMFTVLLAGPFDIGTLYKLLTKASEDPELEMNVGDLSVLTNRMIEFSSHTDKGTDLFSPTDGSINGSARLVSTNSEPRMKNRICFYCNTKGHIKNHCKKRQAHIQNLNS